MVVSCLNPELMIKHININLFYSKIGNKQLFR